MFQLGKTCYKPKLRGIDSRFLLAPAIGTPEEELASLSPKLHAEDRNSTLLKRDLTEHCLPEKEGMANYLRLPNRLPILFPKSDEYGSEWHSSQWLPPFWNLPLSSQSTPGNSSPFPKIPFKRAVQRKNYIYTFNDLRDLWLQELLPEKWTGAGPPRNTRALTPSGSLPLCPFP